MNGCLPFLYLEFLFIFQRWTLSLDGGRYCFHHCSRSVIFMPILLTAVGGETFLNLAFLCVFSHCFCILTFMMYDPLCSSPPDRVSFTGHNYSRSNYKNGSFVILRAGLYVTIFTFLSTRTCCMMRNECFRRFWV